MAHGVSSIDNSTLLLGRPYGGVGILWHKKWSKYVQNINVTESNRVCAIDNVACPLVIVCCYPPCDTYSNTAISDDFLHVMDSIECLRMKYPHHAMIVGGDLNVDVDRNTAHVSYFNHVLERCCLVDQWSAMPSRDRFTYCDLQQNAFSCIDRWLLSVDLPCTDAYVRHEGHNPSKHSVIVLRVSMQQPHHTASERETQNTFKPNCIEWHKALPFVNAYRSEIDMRLAGLEHREVIGCTDLQCADPRHLNQIDAFCEDLVRVVLDSDHIFPRKSAGRRSLCGWNERVRPFKQECVFWFEAWKAFGQPREGAVFESMREAKRQYMYAVRRLKRQQRELQSEKFARALAADRSRDFFAEAKKLSPRPNPVNLVNGIEDEAGIANVFCNKYRALYNSVLSEGDEMTRIAECIESSVSQTPSTVTEHLIDANVIKRGIRKLKHCKSDGDVGYNSSHLLHASDLYFEHLASLFSAMFVHGHQAASLLQATIISLPKDYSKSLCNDSNYRGIALCSSIAKLVDLIIMLRNEEALHLSDMQCAFKPGHSTATCTYVVKEVVQHYINRGSNVYACFLDATKAFDRVQFSRLFEELIKRKMHPVDLRLLLDLYQRQRCRTRWKGSTSQYFSVGNGIRQGSVISPVLFCAYLDVLLLELEKQKVGCHVGNKFFGCMAYADDIVLLSPSISGLRSMLSECENYCSKYLLQFNATKSVCVCFGRSVPNTLPDLFLLGDKMSWQSHVKHLGHIIMYNLSEEKEIAFKRGDIAGRVNTLLAKLPSVDNSIVMRLFNSQCAHFYGCVTWNLCDKSVDQFCTMYNRCVRRVLKLPYRTHKAFLPYLSKQPLSIVKIYQRCSKFIQTICTLGNRIGFLGRLCQNNHLSILSKNLHAIQAFEATPFTEDNIATAQAIDELLNDFVAGFSREEAVQLAHFLCVA